MPGLIPSRVSRWCRSLPTYTLSSVRSGPSRAACPTAGRATRSIRPRSSYGNPAPWAPRKSCQTGPSHLLAAVPPSHALLRDPAPAAALGETRWRSLQPTLADSLDAFAAGALTGSSARKHQRRRSARGAARLASTARGVPPTRTLRRRATSAWARATRRPHRASPARGPSSTRSTAQTGAPSLNLGLPILETC